MIEDRPELDVVLVAPSLLPAVEVADRGARGGEDDMLSSGSGASPTAAGLGSAAVGEPPSPGGRS